VSKSAKHLFRKREENATGSGEGGSVGLGEGGSVGLGEAKLHIVEILNFISGIS
jgi:hypothetical protein